MASTNLLMAEQQPALILENRDSRVLVVADLHLGWEATLVKKGINLPSQAPRMLSRLLTLVERYRPEMLVFLGDVKHSIAWAELEERRAIPSMMDRLSGLVPKILVVPGNHDGNLEELLPEGVDLLPSSGFSLWGEFGLFHGHAWPSPELLGCKFLIQGHLHPVVSFRGAWFRITRQVWVKAPCRGEALARAVLRHLGVRVGDAQPSQLLEELFNVKLRVEEVIVMPSFNNFLGGQPINLEESGWEDPALMGPVLRSGAVNVEEADVYLLDGTFLGTVGQLRRLRFG